MKPTDAELREAHRAARLSMPFETAMQYPALAICLNKTAEVIAKRRRQATASARPDIKKLAAGDTD